MKNRAEAESQVRRDNTWDWFSDDIYTRLEPQRRDHPHPDPLARGRSRAGRLIRKHEDGGEQWEILSLPACQNRER